MDNKLYGGTFLGEWRNWLDRRAREQSLTKRELALRDMITAIGQLRKDLEASQAKVRELRTGEARPPISKIVIPCDTITLGGCCGVLECDDDKPGKLECNECGKTFLVKQEE